MTFHVTKYGEKSIQTLKTISVMGKNFFTTIMKIFDFFSKISTLFNSIKNSRNPRKWVKKRVTQRIESDLQDASDCEEISQNL